MFRYVLVVLLGALGGVLVIMVAINFMEHLGLLPWRRYYNPTSFRNNCIANLKQIDAATATWAEENKKSNSDIPTPTDLYGATAYIRDEPLCPLDGKYVIGSVQQKPRCSIPGHSL